MPKKMNVLWPLNSDPEFEWEAQKYENPIPSRQYILQALESCKGPTSVENLSSGFGLLDEGQLEAFSRRLQAMQRAGQLIQTRSGAFGLVDKMHLLKGRVQGHKDGFGFFIPDDGSEDLFLPPKQMRQVFDGDRVLARKTFVDRRGRANGGIVEILERNTQRLVGQFVLDSGIGYVVPDNKRINQDILIAPEHRFKASPGQFVVVDILVPPDHRHLPQGKIIEILGNDQTPGIEIDVALRTHGIPSGWSDDLLAEIDAMAETLDEKDLSARHDLRDLPFVTIDGEDAKDFDDAVYAEATPSGGFKLMVAIADVSHYVATGSALDQEAQRRGTSVYFPGYVVPMLPELLSNGVCSLKPHEDRLAMVCQMTLTAAGKVQRTQFFEAVILSHARLTYTQVGAYLESQEAAPFKSSLAPSAQPAGEDILKSVDELYRLYQVLRSARMKRGAIDFDTVETRILFNQQQKIADIQPTVRNEAHRLIEECMLQANVATAKLLEKAELPALFRVHREPKQEKLDQVNDFLAGLGIRLPRRKKVRPEDYQAVLNQVKDRPDAKLIQTVLLRSMQQAVYEPENHGHFGLAYTGYTHFTSPIRRYPDLVVHRAIRYLIRSRIESPQVKRLPGAKRLPKKDWLVQKNRLVELGEHCSFTERRADEATRQATDWLKCEYMADKVGDMYPGLITGVVGFGFFVELTDVYVEGLVHVSNLPSDYYHFDAVRHCLVGERSGVEFGLGEPVTIQVAKVNVEDRQIDFELLTGGRPAKLPTRTRLKTDKKNKSGQGKKGKSRNDRHKSRSKSGASKKSKRSQSKSKRSGKK